MDINSAVEIGIDACKKASKDGADIILFPEMWSIGYQPPFENAFDNPVEPGHNDEIKHWSSLAVDENSYFISSFRECAKTLKTAIAIT